MGSVVVAHGLYSEGSVCGKFPDQGSNPCPFIGRRILNHCATREVPRTGSYLPLVFGPYRVLRKQMVGNKYTVDGRW